MLLAEFGAAGPYLWLVLILRAKAAYYAELNKATRLPGVVTLAWVQLAQAVAIDVDTARRISTRLVELDELALDDHGHTATFKLVDLRWELEPEDPQGAARKAAQRG